MFSTNPYDYISVVTINNLGGSLVFKHYIKRSVLLVVFIVVIVNAASSTAGVFFAWYLSWVVAY